MCRSSAGSASPPPCSPTPPPTAPRVPSPPAPVARRAFERGEDLSCRFEVYGAAVDPTGVPRVFMGYALKRADGSIVRRVEPAEIRPTSLGGLSRLFYLRLQGRSPASTSW